MQKKSWYFLPVGINLIQHIIKHVIRVVFDKYFTGTEAGILIPELPAGIYVVKLEDRGGMHHQALFLQGR